MTVADLITALLDCPDPDAEVQARVNVREGGVGIIAWVHVDITDVDQDQGTVLLDTETIPGQL